MKNTEHKEIREQYEGFYYKIARTDTFLEKIGRRLNQFCQIMFSNQFSNDQKIRQGLIKRYSSDEELKYYTKYIELGLHDIEKEGLDKAREVGNLSGKLLVVGSGAGREAFYLEKNYPFDEIKGIDICPAMVSAANNIGHELNSSISFIEGDISSVNEKFDAIWVTSILDCHIQGRKNRINFFQNLARCCKPGGVIIQIPQIRKLDRNIHYYWGSQLLRLRWIFNGKWEEGDSVQSMLGQHNRTKEMIYCHYYPSEHDFLYELEKAGLSFVSTNHPSLPAYISQPK